MGDQREGQVDGELSKTKLEERRPSISEASQSSQTAQEYIASQLQLEQEAREVLPYQFDTCTHSLGPIRQTLFSCLTCNPPPSNPSEPYTPAGVCYSCSISCHGEHELVELFTRRNFVCDCGTSRIASNASCNLRVDHKTGQKGHVRGEAPSATNTYNQNFRNRFCGCGDLYDAHSQKGTMFQCMGLGSIEEGGCGEDWWHPECIMGLSRDWNDKVRKEDPVSANGVKHDTVAGAVDKKLPLIQEDTEPANVPTESVAPEGTASLAEISAGEEAIPDTQEVPLPPGFPHEDDFEHFICYKCTNAFPWIKHYADSPGFLSGLTHIEDKTHRNDNGSTVSIAAANLHGAPPPPPASVIEEMPESVLGKRKADEEEDDSVLPTSNEPVTKKVKVEDNNAPLAPASPTRCIYESLPPPSSLYTSISLFLTADFRSHLCRCPKHYPLLTPHPQLLEEEESYEPPLSEGSEAGGAVPSTHGSRSLLERGEAALSTMDRVRAIEGVMVYNHLRDKVKDFLKPFAESGRAVGAEDVKAYFEQLRGDEEVMRTLRGGESGDSGDETGNNGSHRREQGGY